MTQAATRRPARALELEGVTKRFGRVVALNAVNLTVRVGSVHALLGENGAGKSTLMRIAFGLEQPDSGTVRLFEQPVQRASVNEAAAAGVGMVHQHLSLVPNLTAAENLVLGRRGLFHPSEAKALLARTSEAARLPVRASSLVRDLSIVEQQRLEILKALAFGAQLIIMDEPTAVLAPPEVEDLFRWIRTFVGAGGSVVIVTHKLREALSIADEITVLRNGAVMVSQPAAGSSEEDLAAAIFPRLSAPSAVPRGTVTHSEQSSDILVEATGAAIVDDEGVPRMQSASFALRRGDIVGVAAVEGSGHRELLAMLAGLRAPTSGALRLPPRIALIPADRARDAVIGEFTLTENVALHALGNRRGLMPWNQLARHTERLVEQFSIVAPSAATPLRALSGGNQQRLVVARELAQDVDLVIADNPTRGLDMLASEFVRAHLRLAARRGAAVVVHSSDLDEVLALADRVLVVFHGAVREYPPERDLVGRAVLGAA